MPDLYKLLGISKDASEKDIKKAYRKASSKNHPDRGGSTDQQALINHAKAVLSNPEARKRYDETGDDQMTGNYDTTSRADQILAQIFQSIMQSDDLPPNIVDEARRQANGKIGELQGANAEMAEALAKVAKQRGRVKTKRDHNLVEGLLDERENRLREATAGNEETIIVMATVVEMIDQYEDTRPEDPVPQAFRTFSHFPGSGTGRSW